MKQTAVEFISKGLFDILQEAENNNILEIGTQNFKRYIEMFEKQAKEMEKEQSHKYAEFAIRCDRKDMKILNFEDWIKLETKSE